MASMREAAQLYGQAESAIRDEQFQDFLAPFLGGGFNYFLFSTLLGEINQFDTYFSDGLVKNHHLL